MEPLTREAGTSTPWVEFNPETGMLQLGGESYPENERAQDTIEEFREDYSMPFEGVPHEEYAGAKGLAGHVRTEDGCAR